MNSADLEFLINENFTAFLMLGGLFVIMYVYRETKLPATKTFVLIAVVLFIMCVAHSLEGWAVLSPERHVLRMTASIVHYILQPLVIYLELIVLLPEHFSKAQRLIYAVPLLLNTVIYLAAPFAGHLVFWYESDYSFDRGPLGFSIYIVTFFYIAILIYWSARSFHVNDRRRRIVLIFMVGIAILTGILEGLNVASGHIDEAFVLGVIMFYIYLVTVHEHDVSENLMHKELELSKSELSLLRQQIRPHFVFNSLSIIRSLIRSNPDKAVEGLGNFSDYLRANLDVLKSQDLVSFDEELDNIEAYVSLALADESKDVEVVYDIKERYFRLPPLSIEPLVENAIIHGIAGGGTVTLSTSADDDSFIVVVSDDGVGFDTGGTPQEKKRRGIGVRNVRTRIEKQCGGSLAIESNSNGTTVTVRIPKDQGE